MGGGELKLYNNKIGLIKTISICLFLSLISISHISAQTEVQGTVAADPIQAAEQALPLGGDPVVGEQLPTIVPSSTFAIFRMVLVLILAAAAIYGVVYIIKRTSSRKESADPFLKVLASAQLGPGRFAHVISLGSKAWLVGAADG